jgi:hypothetical protein
MNTASVECWKSVARAAGRQAIFPRIPPYKLGSQILEKNSETKRKF